MSTAALVLSLMSAAFAIVYLPLAPFWIALLLVVGFLMVSTWRFYSFKDLNLSNRHPSQTIILICAFLGLLVFFHHYLLFIIAFTYMISGILTRIFYLFRRRPSEPPAPAYNEAPEHQ